MQSPTVMNFTTRARGSTGSHGDVGDEVRSLLRSLVELQRCVTELLDTDSRAVRLLRTAQQEKNTAVAVRVSLATEKTLNVLTKVRSAINAQIEAVSEATRELSYSLVQVRTEAALSGLDSPSVVTAAGVSAARDAGASPQVPQVPQVPLEAVAEPKVATGGGLVSASDMSVGAIGGPSAKGPASPAPERASARPVGSPTAGSSPRLLRAPQSWEASRSFFGPNLFLAPARPASSSPRPSRPPPPIPASPAGAVPDAPVATAPAAAPAVVAAAAAAAAVPAAASAGQGSAGSASPVDSTALGTVVDLRRRPLGSPALATLPSPVPRGTPVGGMGLLSGSGAFRLPAPPPPPPPPPPLPSAPSPLVSASAALGREAEARSP